MRGPPSQLRAGFSERPANHSQLPVARAGPVSQLVAKRVFSGLGHPTNGETSVFRHPSGMPSCSILNCGGLGDEQYLQAAVYAALSHRHLGLFVSSGDSIELVPSEVRR